MKLVYGKGILLLLVLSLVSTGYLWAGTPPVEKLTVKKGDEMQIFAVGVAVVRRDIFVFTKDSKPVIPDADKCSISPQLPPGLTLRRGEGQEKTRLFISGTPRTPQPLTSYIISAKNNGNVVKKIPAATIEIEILITPPQRLFMSIAKPKGTDIFDLTNKETFSLPFSFGSHVRTRDSVITAPSGD